MQWSLSILKKTPPWSLQPTMLCILIQMILNVENFFVKWQRDIGIMCKSNFNLKHIQKAIGSSCEGKLFIGMFSMWKCCLGFHTNPLKRTSNSMVDYSLRQFKIVCSTSLPPICSNFPLEEEHHFSTCLRQLKMSFATIS